MIGIDQTLMQRGLPSSVESERLVLGSVLMNTDLATVMLDCLEEADFTVSTHALLFRRIGEMYREGIPTDAHTVAEALMKRGELDGIGGFGFLLSLDEGLPKLPHIDAYLKILKGKTVLRRAIHTYHAAMMECFDGGDTAELLARSEKAISDIAGGMSDEDEFATPGSLINNGKLASYLDRRRNPGMLSHIEELNTLTRGFKAKELIILAARTSVGKTAFALNLAAHVASCGMGVPFFSLEMDRQSLTDRILCIRGGVGYRELFGSSTAEDRARVRQAAALVVDLPVYVRDKSVTVSSIHAKVRRLQARHPIGLVVVDYLQLISTGGRPSQNRTQEVGAIANGLKQVAMDLEVPVLALSQLSRSEKGVTRRPMLSDLRESGDIEQAADMVLFLHPLEDYLVVPKETGVRLEGILAKQRNGPLGVFNLAFFRQYGRIEQEYGGASGG